MKKYIAIISGLFLTAFSYGQTIFPLEYDTNLTLPSDAYIKDTNHVFDPYVGVWSATWNGKKFTLVIEKVEQHRVTNADGSFLERDILIGKYSVADLSDGSLFDDNLSETDVDLAKIESLGRPMNNRFNFMYSDRDMCSNTGKILLKGNPATNTLTYYYMYDDFWIKENCGYDNQNDIPIMIPTVQVQLTKQ